MEDEFASKLEERRVAKLKEETEILRVKVENATAKLKEKKREKHEEKERLDVLRRDLKALKISSNGRK